LSSSARATITRWRWPPDSWCGKRPRISFRLQPDDAQGLADQLARLRARRGKVKTAHRRRKHVIDPIKGVVDAVGVLKHRLHITAEGESLAARQLAQIAAPVPDRTAAGLGQAKEQTSKGGLA